MKPSLEQIILSTAKHTGVAADILSGRRGPPPRWASEYRAAIAFIARGHGYELNEVAAALGYKSKGSIFYGVLKIEEALSTDGDLMDLIITVMREFDERAALQTLAATVRQRRACADDNERHSRGWIQQQHERFVAAMREAHPEREMECKNGRFVKPVITAALSLSQKTV